MNVNMQQGSAAWFEARLGKVTASRVFDIVDKTQKGAYKATRRNYMIELLAERLSGIVASRFVTREMQWGLDNEAAARLAYESATGSFVETIGFVPHTYLSSGASPDGHVGTEGGLEIKCPQTHNHLETLLTEKVPEQYIPQIQWQMACNGRLWVDFVSYDPRLPPHLQLVIIRVDRDDDTIATLTAEVAKFNEELDDLELQLKERA